MDQEKRRFATFDATAVRAAIAQLAVSIRAPGGAIARTLDDVETDADGNVRFETLSTEVQRIAVEADLCFEWISNEVRSVCFADELISQREPLLPRRWDTKYQRLDVGVSQGRSEGWMLRICGVRREPREIGGPTLSDTLLVAKYLGSRFEATWLACAIREFLGA